MEKDILEQFQLLTGIMERMEAKMVTKEEALTIDDMETVTDRAANKAAAVIDGTLGKRMDALTDGYKTAHEKQWELERRVEQLERIVEDLRNRIA